MKQLFLFLSIACCTQVFAQQEKPNAKLVVAAFEKWYNSEKYDSIFSLFSRRMKNALPYNKTSDFLQDLHSQAGKITGKEFTRYEQTYASYKTTFERGLYTLNISVDDSAKINGLLVKPYIDESIAVIKRNTTKLVLPFREEWTVIWGGDTKELNYHVESRAQKNAFDIVIKNPKGFSFKNIGKTNDDYYAFGKEIIAPCAGEIVLVVDGIKDNVPGELNPLYAAGNSVIIKTDLNEFIVFAHFKQHTIVVKQGDKVKQGQLLGLCGNSGNSSEPHLHFHLQNVENMNVATGVKCYFDHLLVNGEVKTDYSPVQGEKIKAE